MKKLGALFTITFFFLIFLLNPSDSKRAPASAEQDQDLFGLHRRYFFGLEPSKEYSGLTHVPGKESLYFRAMVGEIVSHAHKLAKDWKDSEPQLYYSFLLGSLVLPFHESRLVHFTHRDPKFYCYFSNDVFADYEGFMAQLKLMEHGSTKIARQKYAGHLHEKIPNFIKLGGHESNFFKSCAELKKYETVQQLLFDGFYADVGIMMLNHHSHVDFFQTNKIFHVDQAMEYGFSYFYQGFEGVASNVKNYPCIDRIAHPRSMYLNIIRGAWSGKYNSGNMLKENVCRFSNTIHKFASNDRAFLSSLNKVLKGKSLYHEYLPIDSIERNFLIDLVENFHQPEKLNTSLDTILSTNYRSLKEIYFNSSEPESEIEVIAEPQLTPKEDIEIERVVVAAKEKEETGLSLVDEDIKVKSLPNSPDDQEFSQDLVEGEIVMIEDEEELISPPEHVKVVLPIVKTKRGSLLGVGVSIRSMPEISHETYCGSSKELDNPAQSFLVKGESGDFYEVENIFNFEGCGTLSVYIYKDFVEVIEEVKDKRVEKVSLKEWVSKRDAYGVDRSMVLGVLGPAEYTVIDEYTYPSEDVWFAIRDTSGKKVWFYAGKLNALKVEVL